MNNEIKKILSNMKKHLEKHKEDYQIIVVENGFSGDSITYELYYDDLSLLLDYITNLQDTLKDREEYCYGLETQITNLQEENKNLKFILSGHWEESYNNSKIVSVDTYKSRNEKALDKLYCYGEVFDSKILQQFQKEMENILQGEDNE